MALVAKNLVFLCKIEGTPGVDAGPDPSVDAIAVANVTGPTPNPLVTQDPTQRGGLDLGDPVVGGGPYTVGVEVQLKGAGSVSVLPECAPLLRIAGITATTAAIPSSGQADCTGGTTTSVTIDTSAETFFATPQAALGRIVKVSGNPATPQYSSVIDHAVAGGVATVKLADTFGSALSNLTKLDVLPAGAVCLPDTGTPPTATVWLYRDGLLWKLVGCVAEATITLNTRQRAVLQVTITGFLASKTSAAVPANPVYSPQLAATWHNAEAVAGPLNPGAFTIAAQVAAASTFGVTLNNQIQNPDNANQTDGIDRAFIVSRQITGTMDPFEELTTTRDLAALFRGNTPMALHGRYRDLAGNGVALTVPEALATNDTPNDANGLLKRTIPFSPLKPTLGSRFVLVLGW